MPEDTEIPPEWTTAYQDAYEAVSDLKLGGAVAVLMTLVADIIDASGHAEIWTTILSGVASKIADAFPGDETIQ